MFYSMKTLRFLRGESFLTGTGFDPEPGDWKSMIELAIMLADPLVELNNSEF